MKRFALVLSLVMGIVAGSRAETITIKGSNTFGEELGPKLIEVYNKMRPDVKVEIEHNGTGSGFEALLAGECDICAASRAATEDEERLARSRGIELEFYIIGYYGASVIVNAANKVRDLSDTQVRDIFSGKITNWKALGGEEGPIHLYIRDPSTGVYLGFQELAMEKRPYAPVVREYKSYGDIADAVNSDRLAIGYTGVNIELRDKVKIVSVNGNLPTPAAISNGVYPYARELRLYVNKKRLSPTAREFLRFAKIGNGQAIMTTMGFVRRIEPKAWPPAPEP